MIFSVLRIVGPIALAAACVGEVACNNSSNPPPAVFVQANVAPTAGLTCPEPSVANVLTIGAPTGGLPTTVNDQGQTSSGQVSVTCTVHPSGGGFDIDLEASAGGTQGGSIIITSPSGAGAVTTSASSGITAHFDGNMVGGPYEDNNCALTYTYMGNPIPNGPTVAAGRIWGHLDCPHAVDPSGGGISDAGAAVGCHATADFLFQQCGQ